MMLGISMIEDGRNGNGIDNLTMIWDANGRGCGGGNEVRSYAGSWEMKNHGFAYFAYPEIDLPSCEWLLEKTSDPEFTLEVLTDTPIVEIFAKGLTCVSECPEVNSQVDCLPTDIMLRGGCVDCVCDIRVGDISVPFSYNSDPIEFSKEGAGLCIPRISDLGFDKQISEGLETQDACEQAVRENVLPLLQEAIENLMPKNIFEAVFSAFAFDFKNLLNMFLNFVYYFVLIGVHFGVNCECCPQFKFVLLLVLLNFVALSPFLGVYYCSTLHKAYDRDFLVSFKNGQRVAGILMTIPVGFMDLLIFIKCFKDGCRKSWNEGDQGDDLTGKKVS